MVHNSFKKIVQQNDYISPFCNYISPYVINKSNLTVKLGQHEKLQKADSLVKVKK